MAIGILCDRQTRQEIKWQCTFNVYAKLFDFDRRRVAMQIFQFAQIEHMLKCKKKAIFATYVHTVIICKVCCIYFFNKNTTTLQFFEIIAKYIFIVQIV